jgi:hypothetical protein
MLKARTGVRAFQAVEKVFQLTCLFVWLYFPSTYRRKLAVGLSSAISQGGPPEKGSSDCADSTGVSAGRMGETALLFGEQCHDRQTRLFFYFNNAFWDVLAPLFNIETSHREGSVCMEPDRAFITRPLKRTARCRHRRTSTP